MTKRFRAGRLTEAHYQVVTNRIASFATRFALRRELGLDDGTPGERPVRTVPIDTPGDVRR